MPKERIELTRGCPQRFLRPSRLPFRHFGLYQSVGDAYSTGTRHILKAADAEPAYGLEPVTLQVCVRLACLHQESASRVMDSSPVKVLPVIVPLKVPR